jgi:SHS2 domain-containing protein
LRHLEHTADVGFDISADTLTELFQGAAAGMFDLLLGAESAPPPPAVDSELAPIRLRAEEPALLLAAWLRELLYWYEMTGLRLDQSEFSVLTEHELAATLTAAHAAGAAVREIKAVTYHQLHVSRENDLWHARVIFDV